MCGCSVRPSVPCHSFFFLLICFFHFEKSYNSRMLLLLLSLTRVSLTTRDVLGDVAWKTKSVELTGDNTCNVKANGMSNGVLVRNPLQL